MRILFLNACYKPYFGGVERVLEQICNRMAFLEEVEEVGILTSYYRYPGQFMKGLPSDEIIDAVKVYRRKFIPKYLPIFYHLDAGLFSPAMRKVMDAFKPTHVHYLLSEWYCPNLQAYRLTRKRAAQIMTIFDHRFTPRLRMWPFQKANTFLANHVDALHVVSQFSRQWVMDMFNAPPSRTKVIPLGVELAEKPEQKKVGQPVTILSVGRLCEKKGQYDLLQCFHKAVKRAKAPCRLILVGEDAGDQDKIKRLVEEYGLQKQVILPGFVSEEELQRLYSESDLFALLTKDESFGLVFTEAMAHGLPVLAYAIAGVPELFPEGTTLAPVADMNAVENIMVELINESDKRSEMSKAAYSFAENHLSWDRMVQQLLDIYRHTARNKSF